MALPPTTPWHYFADLVGAPPDTEADARTALRTLMGTSFQTSPTDDVLDAALKRAVRFFEAATDRFFVALSGTMQLNGNGEPRLTVPHPIVSADQIAGTTLTVTYRGDSEPLDDEQLEVNDGVLHGEVDPRNDTYLEWVPASSLVSRSPEAYSYGRWAYGTKNIVLDGTFGYLEEDGRTPCLVQRAIAGLTIRELSGLDDCDDQEDLRRGAITSETVAGRSISLGPNAQGRGLTTIREIDIVIRRYRRPPVAVVSRAPKRRRRRNRDRWRLE